jgi:hypothetical protein
MTKAAEATFRVRDAAPQIAGGDWSPWSLWRACKRGQVKFTHGPGGIHISASEIARINALQAGRAPRKRTSPFIPVVEA